MVNLKYSDYADMLFYAPFLFVLLGIVVVTIAFLTLEIFRDE